MRHLMLRNSLSFQDLAFALNQVLPATSNTLLFPFFGTLDLL
jgi:hypothetical protein